MSNPFNHADILLIQVRERPDVEQHERDCIIEQTGIQPDQLTSLNLLEDPDPSMDRIRGNVVMIGGAGVLSVTKEHPFTLPLTRIVRRLVDQGIPMLGLCWGHQFIAQALGGEVITDHDNKEVGTHTMRLTAAGKQDPLLAHLPETFSVNMGHNDRISRLPEGAIELAKSALCPNQMFRIEGLPIYGAQFHVEMTARRLRERLAVYAEQYMSGEPELQDEDDRVQDTPEANTLMRRFLEVALG